MAKYRVLVQESRSAIVEVDTVNGHDAIAAAVRRVEEGRGITWENGHPAYTITRKD